MCTYHRYNFLKYVISTWIHTPVISRSLSARVLFPWSMCAIMQKFLILSTGNLERSMESLKNEWMEIICLFELYICVYIHIWNLKEQWKVSFLTGAGQRFRYLGLCADHPAEHRHPFAPAMSDQCVDHVIVVGFSPVHSKVENTLCVRVTQTFD